MNYCHSEHIDRRTTEADRIDTKHKVTTNMAKAYIIFNPMNTANVQMFLDKFPPAAKQQTIVLVHPRGQLLDNARINSPEM